MTGIRGFAYLLGLLCAATICLETVALKTASAQYTVYIYNTKRPSQGWFRAGLYGSVWTTYSNCYQSIRSRVSENKRYKTDFERFAIVLQRSYPPTGALRSYVTFREIYNPSRGFLASTSTGGPTLLASHAPVPLPVPSRDRTATSRAAERACGDRLAAIVSRRETPFLTA